MIEVSHVSKEFVSPKKYPGLKGAIKGLFSNEKVRKTAVVLFAVAYAVFNKGTKVYESAGN